MITPKITNLGYGNLWTDMSTILGYETKLDQYARKLFANNEQGFYYDPNDLTTLFQDAAGTIPVTAAGQPVGLMLDKSGRGNHARQTTAATRPILRRTPILGSELVVNGDFSNGVSAIPYSVRGTVQAVSGVARLTTTSTTSSYGVAASLIDPLITKSGKYLISMEVKSRSITNALHNIYIAPSTGYNFGVRVQPNSGRSSAGLISYVADMSEGETITIYSSDGTATVGDYWDIDNISVKEVIGYRTDQNYLEFDGTDDFLVTDSINFTSTDKVSLFAGVRKLSDATISVVAELSANWTNNPNSFIIYAPHTSGGGNYSSGARGSAVAVSGLISYVQSGYSAPNSAVISVKHDISGDISALRVNTITGVVGTADKGTGNYGNYPLYIGRRGGTSIPFNGHLYSLIGIGRLTTDSEMVSLEKSIAKNTGVTL